MQDHEERLLTKEIKAWKQSQKKEIQRLHNCLKLSFESTIDPSPLGISFATIYRAQFRESGNFIFFNIRSIKGKIKFKIGNFLI